MAEGVVMKVMMQVTVVMMKVILAMLAEPSNLKQ